ncbi:hypothetical protein GR254_24185, partial [Mycobacterium tuberculosis]|nr:hypothetical protein [Mycobacterium tuberculosis]
NLGFANSGSNNIGFANTGNNNIGIGLSGHNQQAPDRSRRRRDGCAPPGRV